jgi:uncharacterized protein (TIGR00369 family)
VVEEISYVVSKEHLRTDLGAVIAGGEEMATTSLTVNPDRVAPPGGALRGIGMRKLNPEYVRIVSAAANRSPYFSLMSMELKDFAKGSSLVEIELQEKHLQPFGVVHGGVFSTIIDAAAFWAVYPEVDEDAGMTSVDLKLNYLAPATAGKLVAAGRCIKLGKTLGLGEATVTDQDGRVLAHGTSTLIVLPGISFAHDGPLPRKFL